LIKAIIKLKLLFLILFALPLIAGGAPYSYSYTPKFLYKNQVFPVTILVKHFDPKDPPNFEFDTLSLVQPLNDKPVKIINKDEAFFTYYFKARADENSTTIPALSIWNLNYTYALNPIEIPNRQLENIDKKEYSGVLASNLRVNSTKVDTYDSSHNLITLNLNATEANIEDMHIPNVIDDGIENLKRSGALATATYYFILPSKKKDISFSYFNTIKNKIISKKISLDDKKSSLSDSKLAPKELNFEKIKKYILISLTILFAISYLLSRDFTYLLFFTISAAILIYVFYPKKVICVNEGAPLYILPTNNSNISMQIDKEIHAKVLHKYNNFSKIEYKNSISGWIKDEDTCKN